MPSSEENSAKAEPGLKSEVEQTAHVAAIVPLHAAATSPIKRGPGRPKKITLKPRAEDLAYHAEMTKRKAEFIESDVVVRSTSERKEAIELLHHIKLQIAQEAAALHFQRIESEKYGKDTSQTSSRRISALREVASIELEIRKMGVQMLDLNSERMQKVFQMLIETFRDVAQEVLDPQQLDLLFNHLETAMEGWEERAERLLV